MEDGTILSAAAYVQKGGVGKTTTAAHVAVAAAQQHELDVLLIDLAGYTKRPRDTLRRRR